MSRFEQQYQEWMQNNLSNEHCLSFNRRRAKAVSASYASPKRKSAFGELSIHSGNPPNKHTKKRQYSKYLYLYRRLLHSNAASTRCTIASI